MNSATYSQASGIGQPKRPRRMVIAEAIYRVRNRFPFDGYMDSVDDAYLQISDVVQEYLAPGSTILDFGAGPCDKTAVLQELGYRCFAYDDLADGWHLIDDNRKKILAFAQQCGIEFRRAGKDDVFDEGVQFDMMMMHAVLEHLHGSPRDLLNEFLRLVRPGGLLFITVPNAGNIRKRISLLMGGTNLPRFDLYYCYPGKWRGHVREYVRDDLVQLARFLDLEILRLTSCHFMLYKVPRSLRVAYLALTSVFEGWRDTWLLLARKRAGWKARPSLPADEMKHMLGTYTGCKYEQA